MVVYRYTANDEQDTDSLASSLAEALRPGSLLALDGDLGAGKTRFSQALARSLGITAVVNSPTFTIIKEYEGGKLPFYHMDVYRISLEEAEELGLEEYFEGTGVSVVEWASRIEPLLPEERLDIYIAHQGDTRREFELRPHGEGYAVWCDSMKESGRLW